MNRRAFLTTLTVIGVGGGSGCLDRSVLNGAVPAETQTTEKPTTPDSPTPAHRRVVLTADQKRWDPTTGEWIGMLGFTLKNRSSQPFVVNPRAWTIHRWTEERWRERATGEPARPTSVAPDTTHNWSLSLRPHPTPFLPNTTFIWAELDEGTHMLTVHGRKAGGDRIDCHAQFELIK